jgi:translocation and assembly module TamB
VDKDTASLKLTLDRLVFDSVLLHYKDKNAGSDFTAFVEDLDATLNSFQPDRTRFLIKDFDASGINFIMNTYKETIPPKAAPVPDSTIRVQNGLYVSADHFNLRNVNVLTENKLSGMLYANKITHLGLTNVLFNMDSAIAIADSLLLDSSSVRFTNPLKKNKLQTKDSIIIDTAAIPWLIKAKELSMKNNFITYDDNNLAKTGGFDFGHFNINDLSGSISGFEYSVDRTTAFVKQLHFKDTSGFVMDSLHVNFLLSDSAMSAKELYVKTSGSLLKDAIEIKYDSIAGMTVNPRSTSLDAVLNNSTIAFNDLYLIAPFLRKTFSPQQFANMLVHFNTELHGNLARVYLPYLQLVGLSGSSLNAHGTLYNLTDANKFSYDLYIEKSNLLKKDLLKFIPPENLQSFTQLPDVLSLTGHITGDKNNLVADVNTSGKGIALSGVFSLKNITDPSRLKYDFAVRSGSVDKNFIMGLIPPGKLPPEINLPAKINFSGKFSGDLNNFVADLKINDSYGLATVKGFVRNMDNPNTATYDLFITTNGYEVGKLISQDSVLGKVTGSFTAKGTGYDYKTMRSTITASVQQLQYKKYNYQHADVYAVFNAGIIDSKGSIKDSSLSLHYDVKTNVQTAYPSLTGMVRVDTAQLKKLHLSNEELNFSFAANINAPSTRPRNLDINTIIDSIKLQRGKQVYSLDSISLIATSAAGRDSINFNSPFAVLHAAGAFDYDKVGDAVIQYVNHYYKIAEPATGKMIPEQQLTFDGTIKRHPLLIGIIPDLKAYDNINFKGSFATADTDSALNLTVALPYLAYQNNTIRNGNIGIASKNERINYAINFDTLNYAANTFYGTRLSGSAAKDSILMSAITKDKKGTDWFGLKASLYAKDKNYSFKLQDSLLLNYERWKIATDNYISYTPSGLIIHNFQISSDTARILINSRQETANSPIDIAIDNFNLKSISALTSNDTILVSGIMDAKMEVNDLYKNIPAFTGNLTVSDLAFMQQPMGQLTASASKQSENNITATVNLQGNGNDITANGNYYLNNKDQEFDAFANVKKLNIATLQGFSFGQIKNATGNIYGNLAVNGKFADPRWKGELNFDTTRFTIAQLNTGYRITSQKIILDYPSISFNNFIVRDSLDHQMKIDGNITRNQAKAFDLKLNINTTDFVLLNAPKAINNELYGYAAVDANISVTGSSVSPNIEGDIFVKDQSNVTMVIPQTSYSANEGKTIVRFIDRDTFDINPPVIPFIEEKEAQPGFAQFLNYNLNIGITKAAALTVIIDPATGDQIRVQGDAQLNAGVDPGGHLVLAGNYELDNGYYLFNYQFLQRKFILSKGSTISFGGTPMRARLDVTAVYTVTTSAKDLLGNEVGSVDPLLSNSFNQKIPFKVMLYLTGEITRPTIKFDIQLPEENLVISNEMKTTIDNKLAQIRGDEAATNKQVFSLLLLNRFTGEQSSDFFQGNGTDFTDIARQSVSQFLSSALNEIAGNLLKGIDVDLNLNSFRDYSNGGNTQRTDLNVALTKTFLDDKLTITLGENFNVEGQDASARGNTSYIPDITIGYKLTKDGKYLLRAYRKNQFEVVLDGYVVETGLGFVVTMDYERFNELFGRRKKKKA